MTPPHLGTKDYHVDCGPLSTILSSPIIGNMIPVESTLRYQSVSYCKLRLSFLWPADKWYSFRLGQASLKLNCFLQEFVGRCMVFVVLFSLYYSCKQVESVFFAIPLIFFSAQLIFPLMVGLQCVS